MTLPSAFANPVIAALDTTDGDQAKTVARSLAGVAGGVKLGLEFFGACGADGVRRVMDHARQEASIGLFLDLKFHDIPNTVAGVVSSVMPLQPNLLTLHAAGGSAMMAAAQDAAQTEAARLGISAPVILAVTVLTSLDQGDLSDIGVRSAVAEQVERLGTLASKAGIGGAVCSPHEATVLRQALGPEFLLVTPGVRPAGAAVGDQKRVTTPAQALDKGADLLVIGRPIFRAEDPAAATTAILESLGDRP
ncbi:MAG: orotidine-5'-phosphate decarboxylase [Rhodospirillaceae bacterium]